VVALQRTTGNIDGPAGSDSVIVLQAHGKSFKFFLDKDSSLSTGPFMHLPDEYESYIGDYYEEASDDTVLVRVGAPVMAEEDEPYYDTYDDTYDDALEN